MKKYTRLLLPSFALLFSTHLAIAEDAPLENAEAITQEFIDQGWSEQSLQAERDAVMQEYNMTEADVATLNEDVNTTGLEPRERARERDRNRDRSRDNDRADARNRDRRDRDNRWNDRMRERDRHRNGPRDRNRLSAWNVLGYLLAPTNCYAEDRYGRVYSASGIWASTVQKKAVRNCERNSSRCYALGCERY